MGQAPAVTKAREIISELDAEELEVIRAERDQALADLRATERECEILRGGKLGVGANIGAKAATARPRESYSEEHEERMAMLEHAVRRLDATLYDIAHRHGDCYDYDSRRAQGEPCDCPVCMARAALQAVADWRYGGSKERPANRYHGAMAERLTNGHHPREVKMHAAWAKDTDDFRLAAILRDKRPAPSARDWYVATSVVQWLGTAVGMGVLEAAGFKYTQWDEDHPASMARLSVKRHDDASLESVEVAHGERPR